ncbi:DUF1292 domain-containing protein [Paenibacillus koleovorans]|uniref:DUF1292 domain-containing protein n=1 Tax=Paenibacillus koleovorans TaxID=121608 RepID=UPI000FD70D71|nr:DUF1292 domain-containing protein [Paenibacillus koleovorans]
MAAGVWPNVKEVRVLREQYGAEIVLFDEQGESEVHRILAEFSLDSQLYAALQSPTLRKEHEFALFRVQATPGEEPQLETIEDDDEWEIVSEIVDDMMYPAGE